MDYETVWDHNLRTNLRLWPKPALNIAALARQDGRVYDENAMLLAFPTAAGKTPTDTRAVRNTFEVMAHAGLVYRSDETPSRLRLTPLGRYVIEFVRDDVETTYATPTSRVLLAKPIARGLALVIEIRVIWELMANCDWCLTNEELNRCMARIERVSDVPAASKAVAAAREAGDPTVIGPRIYKDAEYGTARESDQRKAMNPHFLLAGGGGTFIDVSQTDPYRRVPSMAHKIIERELRSSGRLVHASTDPAVALAISARSGVAG